MGGPSSGKGRPSPTEPINRAKEYQKGTPDLNLEEKNSKRPTKEELRENVERFLSSEQAEQLFNGTTEIIIGARLGDEGKSRFYTTTIHK